VKRQSSCNIPLRGIEYGCSGTCFHAAAHQRFRHLHTRCFLVDVAGPTYLWTLSSKAPLLYDNVLGVAGATFNVLSIFAVKLTFIAILVGVSLLTWSKLKMGLGTVPRYSLLLGPIAISVALMGEFLNDGGRYPFIVLLGDTGIKPAEFMNVYLNLPISTVYAIVGTLLGFLALSMATAYYALNKRFLSDLPEPGLSHAEN
jgi:cytochrome d ubiquinol oxidase subunit I